MTQQDLQCIMCKELEAAVQERELKEAQDHLRALLVVEWWNLRCPWCNEWESRRYGKILSSTLQASGHKLDCPRQAAQAYLDGLP